MSKYSITLTCIDGVVFSGDTFKVSKEQYEKINKILTAKPKVKKPVLPYKDLGNEDFADSDILTKKVI